MPKNESIPLTAAQADDFKLVHGIGPGIEARLHETGIRTYAQLSVMSPEMVVSVLGKMIGLSIQRVIDQDWVGQARALAAQKQPAADPDAEGGRQHYATFAVELLLDEDNSVRRTRTVYIQSKMEDTRAGWDPNRLLDFIIQQAGLETPRPDRFNLLQTEAPATVEAAKISEIPIQDNFSPLQAEAPTTIEPKKISGIPRLKPARIITGLETKHGRILGKDEPFEIILPFDLVDVNLPGHTEIEYKLNLNAKVLGVGSRLKLGEAQGTFELSKENEVSLKSQGLKEGVYRIQVDLTLNPSLLEPESPVMQIATMDGGLLQIY
jgi:hypothetical protein